MRTQAICLALAAVLVCPFASAQGLQTNGLNDQRVPHHLLMATKAFQGTPRGLLGPPTLHRMKVELLSRLDSLRVSHVQSPLPCGKVIPIGLQRSIRPPKKISSPQSQFYVFDTVIVHSTYDTTRHLYSFNTKAKRTTDSTQNLRGGLWGDTLRETNTYDASGNMLSELCEYYSKLQWVKSWRDTYTYDAKGNMLTHLQESWSNGQMMGGFRNTWTYDANGNTLTYLYESWSEGQWGNSARQTCTYDANGNMLISLFEQWANGQWGNIGRQTCTYDANGNMHTHLYEYWSNGQWGNDGCWTYTYDANGNNLISLYEQWANGQWGNSERQTCTYDANGNMLIHLHESWSNGQWVDDSRETYTYDAKGNMLTDMYEVWSNGQMVNGGRETYSHDANGSMLTHLHESWSNGQWVNTWRYTYTYDAGGNLTSLWSYQWLNSAWTPTDLPTRGGIFVVSDSAGNSYHLGQGYSYTFIRRLIISGVASQSGNVSAGFSLSQNYPNPFNPTTKIQFTIVNPHLPYEAQRGGQGQLTIVKVFDILGNEVATLVNEVKEPGTYAVEFNGSNLASGVYFYRLQAGTYVQTRRLLLVR